MSPKLGSVTTAPSEQSFGHRADLKIDERHRSFGQVLTERRCGEELSLEEVEEFLGNKDSWSEIHPTHESKDIAEKFRDKFFEHWGPRTKEMALELYKERHNE